MLRTLVIVAALVLAASAADAQKLDKNGRCHDAAGKFAKAEVCAGANSEAGGMSAYKLDAKGNCHDAKGKMAKKEMCAKK